MGIESLEQPMKADDIAGVRSLPPEIRSQVMADETLLNEKSALELLQPDAACGIFNIKLMKCGGVTEARTIAGIAESAGLPLMWGCMDESVISIAAALLPRLPGGGRVKGLVLLIGFVGYLAVRVVTHTSA